MPTSRAISASVFFVALTGQAPSEPEYIIYQRNMPPSGLPVVFEGDLGTDRDESAANLAALDLLPVERYHDVIRYTLSRPHGYGKTYSVTKTVVQFALAGDGSRGQVLVIVGEQPLEKALSVERRERAWVGPGVYRQVEEEVLRIGSSLTEEERETSQYVMVCSHTPWARLDLRMGGEARLVLTRRAGCSRPASAYLAGTAMVEVAEKALGHEIAEASLP